VSRDGVYEFKFKAKDSGEPSISISIPISMIPALASPIGCLSGIDMRSVRISYGNDY